MATAQKHTYFKALVEDKPGALLAIVKELKGLNIDLIGLKGVSHARQGDILLIPKNPDKLRAAWADSGKIVEEGTLFYLSGVNTVGALERSLDALARANVNLAAIEAESVGTRFGAFVWISPQDIDRASKALKAE